jgi:hypothetical protein
MSVEFENGSKVVAAATSSDAIRGKSCNMLYIDECITKDNIITIKNKKTDEIKIISIGDFYNLLN